MLLPPTRQNLCAEAPVPLHGGFDGLSDRAVLHLSAAMKRWTAHPVLARIYRLARSNKSAAF
jgi:hypothetical protein